MMIRILHKLLQGFRIYKYRLLSDISFVSGKFSLFQPVLLKGKGKIIIGSGCELGVLRSPNLYSSYAYIEAREPSAVIRIANNVRINNNFSLIANASEISIGNSVLIGYNCSISDSDFHRLSLEDRLKDDPVSKPVKIGDNVFIGNAVIILKGVSIGENAVIGAGSVVVSDIPKNAIAVGNPARVIKSIEV
ncbi:MAG: acyltransferase [Flavobacteriaceae bacterium]|nr:acyltransferase [Flavobacteriaceae bacterium]